MSNVLYVTAEGRDVAKNISFKSSKNTFLKFCEHFSVEKSI